MKKINILLTVILSMFLLLACENLFYDSPDKSPHFVAVGENGSVHTSNDGKTWSANTGPAGVTTTLYDVTYGAGMFVACGYGDGNVYRSVDGINWQSTNTAAGRELIGITYHNGIFAICSRNYSEIWRSTDAMNWASTQLDDLWLGIGSGNGYFVAVNGWARVANSIDGFENYQVLQQLPTHVSGALGVAYGNNVFLTLGDNGYITRSINNGSTWDNVLTVPGDGMFYDAVYGNGRFVAVGDDDSSNSRIYYSDEDGENWFSGAAPSGGILRDICYGNGVFVTVGDDGKIYYSNDGGETWSGNVGTGSENLHGVEFQPGS